MLPRSGVCVDEKDLTKDDRGPCLQAPRDMSAAKGGMSLAFGVSEVSEFKS